MAKAQGFEVEFQWNPLPEQPWPFFSSLDVAKVVAGLDALADNALTLSSRTTMRNAAAMLRDYSRACEIEEAQQRQKHEQQLIQQGRTFEAGLFEERVNREAENRAKALIGDLRDIEKKAARRKRDAARRSKKGAKRG